MFALHVTHFTQGNRKQLILVAVLIALTSVLVLLKANALRPILGVQIKPEHPVRVFLFLAYYT